MHRLFIKDYALTNALGSSKQEIWENWRTGQCPGMDKTDVFSPGKPRYVARIREELPEIAEHLSAWRSRNNQLLQHVADGLAPTINALIDQYGAERIGLVLGTSTSGITVNEAAVEHARDHDGKPPADYGYKQHEMGGGADFLKAHLGLKGPAMMISTACSSSGNAFATARRLIDTGICDAVIVGGADTLCKLTLQGFSALESISTDVCNPFSQNRSGITIGEAAALFIVDTQPSDIEFLGAGQSSDAHHISAPEPNGSGAQAAMQAALNQAGLEASVIDYVNLHGTATPLNDAMESTAVHELLQHGPQCSSTKSLTGHTLGAAAATELGFCAMLLEQTVAHQSTVIPPQVWDGEFDPALAPINIASAGSAARPVQFCLSNSFAFGGNNTSLLIGINHDTRA